MTSTPTPRKPLMIDSLAEHVVPPVNTKTRDRFKVGNCWGGLVDVVERNGSGVNGCPVTGSIEVCLSLNVSLSNVCPEVRAEPAIMYASWLAKYRKPPPL